MLKVAIVGCGKIADAHALALHRIEWLRDRRGLRQGAAHGAATLREVPGQKMVYRPDTTSE